jgi:hypothetical protein
LATTSPSILDAIAKHQEAIFQNVRYRKRCLRCDATEGFKKHELRRRKIRVILSLTVQVLSIVLVRWKCLRCGLVFTDWPDFRTPVPTLCQHEPAAAGPRVPGARRAVVAEGCRAPRPSDGLRDAIWPATD